MPGAGAGMPGMTPEMMANMSPEQIQMLQQMQAAQGGAQAPSRGGMFGMPKRPQAPPPQAAAGDGSMAGFIAWDFRVIP